MAGGWCGSALGVGQLVIFLPFHPSVLEPDLDLPLGETKRVRNLDPPPPGQVPVKMKLLLQLQDLLPGVGCSGPFGLRSRVIWVHCLEKKTTHTHTKEVTKCGQCSMQAKTTLEWVPFFLFFTRGAQTLRQFTWKPEQEIMNDLKVD